MTVKLGTTVIGHAATFDQATALVVATGQQGDFTLVAPRELWVYVANVSGQMSPISHWLRP